MEGVGQQVADQLVDEVMLRLSRVGALLPGLDHDLDRHGRQMRAAATDLADQLAAGGPRARTVAATVYSAMWAVEDAPRASWWQTPLGRALAAAAKPAARPTPMPALAPIQAARSRRGSAPHRSGAAAVSGAADLLGRNRGVR